jgi:hypothetical protein
VDGGVVTLTRSLNIGTAVAARLGLTYNNVDHTNPSPGFAAPTRMVVSPGSFQQVVN